jgi:dipeptidase
LETAGSHWVTERVKNIRSISNRLSISKYAEEYSTEAKDFAQQKGWWDGKADFNFQHAYSDWLYTKLGRAAIREACTTELSMRQKGKLDVSDCIQILKTHNVEDNAFKPSKANTGSVCMHATGLLNPSQTTGSMVAKIRPGGVHTIWMSGTSNPCLSVYLPFFFGTKTLQNFKQPSAQPDESLWWQAEKLHRRITKDYQKRTLNIREEIKSLQQDFFMQEEEFINNNPSIAMLEHFSNNCLGRYRTFLAQWTGAIKE